MRITGRTIALLALAAALTGCAQPGQLGSAAPEVTAVPPPAPLPGPPSPAPVPADLDVTGRLAGPATVTAPGPSVFSVAGATLAPGESSGWLSRPGTQTSVVRSGSVTVLTSQDCDGTTFDAGEAVFVPDAEPQLVRNDGSVPADLVVTTLLAPGVPDRTRIADPC